MRRHPRPASLAFCILGLCLLLISALSHAQEAGAPRPYRRMTAPASPSTLQLPKMLVPAEGSQAAFIIVERAHVELGQQSGIFALIAWDELGLDESLHQALRVHYTVLAPDEASGHSRVLVRAQPLDVDTGAPASADRWEAVYTVGPAGVALESGDPLPEDYADSISPDWLTDWLFTPAEDLPDVLQPGAQWTSEAEMDLDDVPFELQDIAVPVTGQFVAWVDVPDVGRTAAHIHETFSGQASMREDFDGVEGTLSFDLEGYQDYWLIPDEFPYEVDQSLQGVIVAELTELVEELGLGGSFEFKFSYHRLIRRDTGAADVWLPVPEGLPTSEPAADDGWADEAHQPSLLRPGEPVFGTLGEGSQRLADDTPVDYYVFNGVRGQRAHILLESDDFDAYLFLQDDQEETLATDDDSGGGTDAYIEYRLPYTGPYLVLANTYFAGESGNYTLTLELTEPLTPAQVDWGRIHYLVARLQAPDSLTDEELDEAERTLHQLLELVEQERLNR